MADFTDSSRRSHGLDPRKRVNYPLGMVLGADEFEQEQFYLRARDHLGVRALHGYGTVSGLAVTWNDDTGQVEVAPGLAVDPVGRFVCVPTAQCADLSEWLTAHRSELEEAASIPEGSPPSGTSLYVVLCHQECPTDTVPVPSETCRSADESMAASRLLESFELKLLLAPPHAAGEVAGNALDAAIDRILAVLESTPADSVADVDALRRELLIWATAARPELSSNACLNPPADNCGDHPEADSTAVLLARIDLDLDEEPSGRIVPLGEPDVRDDDRPVLVSTRFLQEWLTEVLLHPELLGPPPITDHNELDNLTSGDAHTQYLPADGSRPLTGDLDADGHRVTQLGTSADPDHAMRRDEIVDGDLGPSEDGLRITELQGVPVQAAEPNTGDLLRFDGTSWAPAPVEPVGPAVVLPFVTIELMGRSEEGSTAVFLLWFNLEVPEPSVMVEELVYGEQFRVVVESCDDRELALRQVASNRAAVTHVGCNVFRVDVTRNQAEFLRFVFHLQAIQLNSGETLAEFAEAREITWVGQDGEDTVTKFVLNPSVRRPIEGFEEIEAVPAPSGGGHFVVERR